MSTFTITLSNGRQLSDITMNGSMFVSKTEVTTSAFSEDALKSVVISEVDDGKITNTTITNAVCDGVLHWSEGWLFNLREMTDSERSRKDFMTQIESLNADLTNTQLALCDVYEMIGG